MGTRPNVRPPAIVSTSIGAVLPETENENQCATETGSALMNTDDELLDIPDPVHFVRHSYFLGFVVSCNN